MIPERAFIVIAEMLGGPIEQICKLADGTTLVKKVGMSIGYTFPVKLEWPEGKTEYPYPDVWRAPTASDVNGVAAIPCQVKVSETSFWYEDKLLAVVDGRYIGILGQHKFCQIRVPYCPTWHKAEKKHLGLKCRVRDHEGDNWSEAERVLTAVYDSQFTTLNTGNNVTSCWKYCEVLK